MNGRLSFHLFLVVWRRPIPVHSPTTVCTSSNRARFSPSIVCLHCETWVFFNVRSTRIFLDLSSSLFMLGYAVVF